jgi:hypothetical protein
MYVKRVKIPLHGSAPVQREKVMRYREVLRSTQVSSTTARNYPLFWII